MVIGDTVLEGSVPLHNRGVQRSCECFRQLGAEAETVWTLQGLCGGAGDCVKTGLVSRYTLEGFSHILQHAKRQNNL